MAEHQTKTGKNNEPLALNVTEIETIDTVAGVILGILSTILLIALLRSQARVRSLLVELSKRKEQETVKG
jgi:CBS-domain-containing membrane protein